MKSFSASAHIDATPEAVWTILTDASGYPSWDDTLSKIEGTIGPGETLTLHHRELDPKVLPVKITAFEPNRRMIWTGGGMPEAVFKGEHIFELTEDEQGMVDFSTHLVFSGLMAGIITKSIPDMQPYMERSVAALKKKAEQARRA